MALTREERAAQIRWEEYKMIQDKIDRIGDFKFRVRGWIISLIAGGVTAAAVAGTLPPVFFVIGFFTVLGFHRMEIWQTRWERALGNRALILEAELHASYGAPGTIDEIRRIRNAILQGRLSTIVGPSDSRIFYGLLYLAAATGFVVTLIGWPAICQLMRQAIDLIGALMVRIHR